MFMSTLTEMIRTCPNDDTGSLSTVAFGSVIKDADTFVNMYVILLTNHMRSVLMRLMSSGNRLENL